MIKAIIFIAACAISTSHAAQQCLIVGVSDGDTLRARCGTPGAYEQVKIRLSEIDAPESKQAFGERSKQSLSELCFQQQAVEAIAVFIKSCDASKRENLVNLFTLLIRNPDNPLYRHAIATELGGGIQFETNQVAGQPPKVSKHESV